MKLPHFQFLTIEIPTVMKRKLTYLFWMLMMSAYSAFGFTFTATPTNETCAGNGTITFTSADTDPAGTLVYVVYKLPDVTVPYATVNGNNLGGLSAGTYRIIARETVGSVTTTEQIDVVINNAIVPLVYTIQSLNQACSDTSNISVTATSGIAVTYEIFDGPLLFPSQTGNTFSGLPVGVYKIRVFNNCGIGVVQTFTVTQNVTGITIAPPTYAPTVPPSCNFMIATNILTPATGTVLGYPLNISYTVYPPNGGTPINSSSVILNGNPTSQGTSFTLPQYINEVYNYDITVTDACGSVYTQNFNVNNNIGLINSIIVLDCNENYFEIIISNFNPPYTMNFTTVPAGFNPAAFNASYPGPYFQPTTTFGSDTNTVPLGNYVVVVTDACGRTQTSSFAIVLNVPVPNAIGINNGCLTNTGGITVNIPSFQLTTAIITVAPASYPFPLPHDVSSQIDANGELTLNPVPLGDYTFVITDNCNSILSPLNVNVPPYTNRGLSRRIRPGCTLGTTSVEIWSNNGRLQTVFVVTAPPEFGQTLPFNVSSNITISDGIFYLDDMPGGTYVFLTTDECNFTSTITVNAPGYAITSQTFSLEPNCGSFDIPLNFISNGTQSESFWLQKLIDATTDTWGHPGTEVLYPANSVPNSANSLELENETTNFNLSYNGTFRIVRRFISYNDGVTVNAGANTTKNCIEILSPSLSFNQSLDILDANRLPCSANGDLDVVINAVGFPPLQYSIIEMNGAPFFLNNGTSNVFQGLPVGVYKFLVEDGCGNQLPRIFDIATLFSLVNITQPNDVMQCQTVITGNETFDLTQQTPIIMGSQSPTEYTLSYHTSLANAQSGTNAIVNLVNFNPTTNPQTIYARLIFNPLPSCYEVRSFDVIVGQIPQFNLQPDYLNCGTNPIVIDASTLNLPSTTYVWSNGATTPSVTVTQLGTTNLSVTATNTYGINNDLTCTATFNIIVTVSELPRIESIETIDWTDNENSITIHTANNSGYEFSLDGITYQDDNYFTNLVPGLYTVFVQDRNGCGFTTQEVWLLYHPKYFTPNGDGIHDRWFIKYSNYEPDLKIVVYDRFGKAMASFDALSQGWDGTYNNLPMFATDYWFVVYRQDGRVHRGHFALKR